MVGRMRRWRKEEDGGEEMYEYTSNCNDEHETYDENLGQEERRRKRTKYVMIWYYILYL